MVVNSETIPTPCGSSYEAAVTWLWSRIAGQVETASQFDSGDRFAPFAHSRSLCRSQYDVAGVLLQIFGETEAGSMPGSGLTVEISPLSFPNRDVVLRGRTPRWKRPVMFY